MTRCLHGTVFALAALVLGAQAYAQGYNPGSAARVNGVDISNQRFDAFYSEYRRTKGVAVGARGDQLELMKQLRREAMDMIIEQELLVQAADAKGIEVPDEEVDAELAKIRGPFTDDGEFQRRLDTESYTLESFREHLRDMIAAKRYLDEIRLEAMEVTDEELEKYYRDNERRLTLPEQVHVRHILLSWKPLGQPDDKKALYDQMNAIRDKAVAGEDFAELAKEYSDDSTRIHGGDVGFFHRGQMVPAFENAAFALQPGEISDIVATPFGLHIIKLEARKESRLLPLDEIRDQLRDHIREENMENAVEEEYARLREQADIAILVPLGEPEKKK